MASALIQSTLENLDYTKLNLQPHMLICFQIIPFQTLQFEIQLNSEQ